MNHTLITVLEKDNPEFHMQKTDAVIGIIEHTHGIKISLYYNGGQVNIPYWHSDQQVQRLVFWNVRRYLRLIQSETDYAIYDPQLGRVVTIESDMSAIMASYQRAIINMPSFL